MMIPRRDPVIHPTSTGEIVLLDTATMLDAEREVWRDWARENNVDPEHAIGVFEIDRVARKIRYLAYDVDENGHRFLFSDGTVASRSMHETQVDGPITELPRAPAMAG